MAGYVDIHIQILIQFDIWPYTQPSYTQHYGFIIHTLFKLAHLNMIDICVTF
jgi:hypothetical protein